MLHGLAPLQQFRAQVLQGGSQPEPWRRHELQAGLARRQRRRSALRGEKPQLPLLCLAVKSALLPALLQTFEPLPTLNSAAELR